MSNLIAAKVFPPGDFLREEIEARGWTQTDLAEILGRPPRVVNEIIAGKRAITPETAKGLGEALGTGAHFWMNLESAWQLSKVRVNDSDVAKRALLYEKAPVKEMQRRNWLEPTSSAEVLEARLLAFLELPSLEEEVSFAHAARKSTSYTQRTPAQLAWLCRCRQLARAVDASRFTRSRLPDLIDQLRSLLVNPEDVRRVPGVLADFGIRFVIVEQLAGTRIDGACFWLDKASPVIALSMRFDRIDWFWFTLMHELAHVEQGDGIVEPGS
jgi:HTH-type transcriptional regulator/antitoxin HigA